MKNCLFRCKVNDFKSMIENVNFLAHSRLDFDVRKSEPTNGFIEYVFINKKTRKDELRLFIYKDGAENDDLIKRLAEVLPCTTTDINSSILADSDAEFYGIGKGTDVGVLVGLNLIENTIDSIWKG